MLLQINHIPWYQTSLAGTPVTGFIWFFALLLFTLLLKRPASGLLALWGSRLATRFSNGQYGRLFRSLIRRPLEGLITVILFFMAFNHIGQLLTRISILRFHRSDGALNITLADLTDHLFLFAAILYTTLTLSRIIDFIYRVQAEKAAHAAQKERMQLLPLVKDVAKVLLWSAAFFWMLGVVFHVNIPALITGLGIGGVAIALAAKESVENMFASFTILADKPFEASDTIRLGVLEGKVERIGFRSTRLRGVDGSLFIIPNKKLVDENLENLTQRDTRGVRVLVNLKYSLNSVRLREMLDAIRNMVQTSLHVTQPIEVSLDQFNENTIQLVVSYHIPQQMQTTVAEIRQAINMRIYELVYQYTGQPAGGVLAAPDPEGAA